MEVPAVFAPSCARALREQALIPEGDWGADVHRPVDSVALANEVVIFLFHGALAIVSFGSAFGHGWRDIRPLEQLGFRGARWRRRAVAEQGLLVGKPKVGDVLLEPNTVARGRGRDRARGRCWRGAGRILVDYSGGDSGVLCGGSRDRFSPSPGRCYRIVSIT